LNCVLPAVEFDYDFQSVTGKIDDVPAEVHLPTEMRALQRKAMA